ncbi:relaxase/mobilization nuclease [Streptomyces yangpuensis]|uniref:relaxase/mobilization nuclease n=1 Tax=Streptomyces yangpuensis TaxID=1648182 RepID=UPI00363D2E18
MIIAIHSRDVTAEEALTEALGREISLAEGLTTEPGGTVVAHSNRLDHSDEDDTWSSATWADHLADPSLEHPLASGPDGDRRAILHVTAHMHPLDRELNHAEWSEIGYRIARVAGITPPGDDQACQWIAVQAQPGRLDVIANLIRLDGTWSAQPRRLLQTLVAEARNIEADLLLHSSHRQDSARQGRGARSGARRLPAGADRDRPARGNPAAARRRAVRPDRCRAAARGRGRAAGRLAAQ